MRQLNLSNENTTMRYEILLFDADNTILDFDKAEEQALARAFSEENLQFDRNVLSVYRRNNIAQWQLYEQGKITKQQVLIDRFVRTFEDLSLDAHNIPKIADLYEYYLKFGFDTVPHAREVLEELKDKHRLYLVSNGVLEIQSSRMSGSGLDKYFAERFVSEKVGYPKPQKEYFDYCFAHIPNFDKCKTLVIGDSLSSDIQGGVNAGIDTCWFNPSHCANNTALAPTYEISDLRQLKDIV